MKNFHAAIVMFFIIVSSAAAFAGSDSDKDGKKETIAEPECDYTSVQDYL
jgi:hypothetical protein